MGESLEYRYEHKYKSKAINCHLTDRESLFKFIEARSNLYPKKPEDNRSVDITKFSIKNGFLKNNKGVILEKLERTRLVKAWIKVENVWLL